jgi:outer membrane lipoprotein-sorting protein
MNVFRAAMAAALACSFARADSLDQVLKRMDEAVPQFKSMTANIKRVQFTKLFDDSDVKPGTVRMRRDKNAPTAIWDFTGDDPETIFLAGHTGSRYLPKAKVVQLYDVGKSLSVMQESLLLGFGATSADLRKIYDITLGGEESAAGKRTTRIQFTPKSKDLKDLFTKIDLWIPDGESNPVQEKIWTGTKGDYILMTYTDTKINPGLPDSEFQFKPPSGTKPIKMN